MQKVNLDGEKNILNNFPLATILRPSIVYSVDDNFTTNFMTLLNRLPIFHFIIQVKQNLSYSLFRFNRYNLSCYF